MAYSRRMMMPGVKEVLESSDLELRCEEAVLLEGQERMSNAARSRSHRRDAPAEIAAERPLLARFCMRAVEEGNAWSSQSSLSESSAARFRATLSAAFCRAKESTWSRKSVTMLPLM